MDEYISKQRAKDLMGCCLASAKANSKDETSVFKKEKFKHYAETIEAMIDVVGSVEVADVQPVVHAKWEISSDGYYPYCSRCFGRPNGELTKYCPDCGARMDLDSVTHDRCSNYMDCDGHCFIDDTPCDCDGNIEKCKGR